MLSLNGVAKDKEKLKAILANITISIIKPVKAYAIAQANNTLKEQVSYSFTGLMKMQANEIINKTNELHDLISPLVAALQTAGYNVNAAMLLSMKTAINSFDAAQNSPVQSSKERKNINATIMKI